MDGLTDHKRSSAFGAKTASGYDQWFQTPGGRYADRMEQELFLRLVRPRPGQSLLEVGCGTGHNLEFFQSLGLKVAGIEPSPAMLEIATRRLPGVPLLQARAENLPFRDNSFDLVALITVLEFLPEPLRALREAERVAAGKLYLGVLNRTSLLGVIRRIKAKFTESTYRQATFYTIGEVKRLLEEIEEKPHLAWGSVLHFPLSGHRLFGGLDRFLSFRRSPFGAFLGICLNMEERGSMPEDKGKGQDG